MMQGSPIPINKKKPTSPISGSSNLPIAKSANNPTKTTTGIAFFS